MGAGGADTPVNEKDHRWTGKRIEPKANKVWLVVLEVHWEQSLLDHEFSYGAMLRSFFERLPNIEVRHRFVHDAADFSRFCDELTYIVEPVYLYVSSHGVPQGIVCGGKVLGPEAIGECLANAGDIKLLHLGACLMMSGDAPARIAAALPSHARRFPISGFTEPADWAGSAIVDFTYLDMIFERKVPPSIAAQAVREMVTFARAPKRESPTLIPAMGLTVYDPPAPEGVDAAVVDAPVVDAPVADAP
jgi:hypothetical protein